MGNKIKSFFAVVLCFVIPVMFCSCKKEHTEHTFSQEWVSDENSHWHPCTFEGCTEKSDSAEHTWDNGTVSGHKTIYKCTVCERTKETVNEHIANTTEWEKDDTQHWHACTIDGCTEKVNASSHDWNEGIVVGHYTNYECLTCGQTKQVKNPCKAKINGAWSKDDDYHWHDCSVGSCDEKVDKALHNWGEGEPSGHYINYTCRDCGLIKSDKIPCDYDLSKWEYDETHHWHPCTIDGCELTSEKVEHNFDYTKGEVEGHYTVYTCSDCNATKYVKNDCIPASEWQKNDNYHWHYCTILGCSEELDKSEHTWNNGVLTEYGLLITCTMCGTERLECGDCSYDTENWEKNEDFHWHACKNVGCTSSQDKAKHDYLEGTRVVINGDGSHLLIKTCGTCGYEHSELLEHSFEGAEWESDETHHWLECIVEGCTIIDEKIEHRFDKTLVGHNYVYTCVCGKTKTEKAECQFVDTEWESDEIHHWHECTIEGCTEDTKIKDKGTHTWNDGEILGHSITYTCTICGLNKTEDAEHNYTNAEWQSDETYHWHECTIDGCTEIDEQIEHTFGKPVIVDHRNVYTCECGYKKYETIKHNYEWDKGNETNHWQYCTIEGCTVTQNHATHTWEKISTSNAESGTGHIEIYKCTVCQREKQKNISCDVDTTAWKLDETHHWHACTIDGCTIKDSKEEHDFEKVTKGDEVTYTCKKCNFIKKEYLNIYIRGIEALASNPYKITLKNFELKTDTYQNIDFSELYLGLDDDNKIIGYGYCNITEPDTNNTLINVIAYIEDETIYFSYTNETDYNISIYTISQFFNELDILVSGKIEGGLTSIMQILSQANTTFSEEIDTIIKYFVGIYNRAELNSKLEKFVEYFYTKSKVEDTFVYTFNYNSLRKLNKFFDTKSVADVIDMINGEGSFDLLIDYLKSAVDLTVSQWLEVGKDNGLDIDAVLDYLDVLAQKYYEMVTGDSEIMEDEEQLEEPSEEQKITFEMLIGSITGMEIPDIGEYIKSEDVKDKTVVDAINLIIDMINQKLQVVVILLNILLQVS